MKDSKQSDQEVFESIPWEELRDLGDTSRRRRTWYLIAGAAVVAVLIFSVARTFSAPDPMIAVVTATTSPAAADASSLPPVGTVPTIPPLDSPPAGPTVFSEADLMAGEDDWAEDDSPGRWQAASYSEWFVLDFFTLDGSDRRAALQRWLDSATFAEPSDALSYVEWVRTLQVEPLVDGRWRSVVGVRRLVSSDGVGYTRLPTQAVEVVVDLGTQVPAIVDVPRFVPLPEAAAGQWWMGEPWETPPVEVIRAARDEMTLSQAGTMGGEPKVTRTGEAWRVEWAVVDQAGISWPVSLWIGPEGTPVPAGG